MSRSIGDIMFKTMMVTEPDTKKVDSLEDSAYLFMACDGIFDVVNKDEIPGLIKEAKSVDPGVNLAKYFVKLSKERKSDDNLSVIVVEL